MKTKFILGFLFIMITLVSLHNIHVLNTSKHSQVHFQCRYQTLENETVF